MAVSPETPTALAGLPCQRGVTPLDSPLPTRPACRQWGPRPPSERLFAVPTPIRLAVPSSALSRRASAPPLLRPVRLTIAKAYQVLLFSTRQTAPLTQCMQQWTSRPLWTLWRLSRKTGTTNNPKISKSWRENWANLSTYFKYPQEVRRLIYTTNTIEGFNRQLRKVTKSKSVFPTDDSLLKMLYLAMMDITKKWTGRRQDWSRIHAQLSIYFAEWMPD